MLSILIVDDEPLIRRGLKTIIHRISSEFIVMAEASNGFEALELVKRNEPDVIISDIKMPEKDGLDLAKEINEKYPNIFIVILSGYDDFCYAQRAIKYKVYDYVLKPIDSENLENLLKRINSEIENKISDKADKNYLDMHISGKISTLFALVKQKDLVLNIKLVNVQAVEQIADDIFKYLYDNKLDIFYMRRAVLELYNTVLNDLSSINYDIQKFLDDSGNKKKNIGHLNSIESIKLWFNTNIIEILEYVKTKQNSDDIKVIDKIKKYIRENYGNDITLNLLAGKFYLNPSYLSELFKVETKQNFLEYLTQVRIEKSIELLCDSRLKVYQISSMVGYESSTHFYKIFKKVTSITPNEYRKKVCNY